MAGLLANFRNTVIVSVILALIVLFAYSHRAARLGRPVFWQGVFRWLHVFFGILWIGLLYYFNFVQIRENAGHPGRAEAGASPSTSRPRRCSGSAGRRWSP